MFPVQRGQGGRGGYGIDIGSGNRAAKGNDIRIRNVLDHLSEGMQVGSHNVSEDDNVIRIGLPANPNPPTQNRDDGGTGEVSCLKAMVALVWPGKRNEEIDRNVELVAQQKKLLSANKVLVRNINRLCDQFGSNNLTQDKLPSYTNLSPLAHKGSSKWSLFKEFKDRFNKMTSSGKEGEERAGGNSVGGRLEDGAAKLTQSGSGSSIVYGRGEGGPADENRSVSPPVGGSADSGATGGGGELNRGNNLPASAPVQTADPVPGGADVGGWDGQGRGWGGWGVAGGYGSGWSGGTGRGGTTGYGIDIGSGNCAAGGNDIRIRNVLGQLSEGMQVGSHNVAGVDNVMSLDLSPTPGPQAADRDVVDAGRLPGGSGGAAAAAGGGDD